MNLKQSAFYQILKKIGLTRVVLFFVCRWNDFVRPILVDLTNRMRDSILTAQCLIYCLLVRKSSLVMHRETPLIVSLTSYPARIKTVYITLYTLLRQSIKPDKIVLWLAKEEFGDKFEKKNKFPFLIRLLIKRGISIMWTENTRPYKKLLPSLKEFSNASIVVCDDDAIYPRSWLKDLYEAHLETPECIVGHRGFMLRKELRQAANEQISDIDINQKTAQKDKLCKYKLCKYKAMAENLKRDIKNKNIEKYRQPNIAIFVEGVGGILFPPHSLPAEVHNQELFQKLSPHADDIWFNAMAMRKGTLRRVVDRPEYLPQLIAGTQKVGLARINLGDGKNDVQLAQVFDYFDLYNLVE